MSNIVSKEQVREVVVSSVTRLMKRAGHTAQVSLNSYLIGGLGLNSEDGEELDCMIEEALGIATPAGQNVLIDESIAGRPRARTLQEVCDVVELWGRKGSR